MLGIAVDTSPGAATGMGEICWFCLVLCVEQRVIYTIEYDADS